VKTVDFHLQSIYRKLGIQRRTQLAWLLVGPSEDVDRAMAAAGGPAVPGSRVARAR
jgi:hypothetical protein